MLLSNDILLGYINALSVLLFSFIFSFIIYTFINCFEEVIYENIYEQIFSRGCCRRGGLLIAFFYSFIADINIASLEVNLNLTCLFYADPEKFIFRYGNFNYSLII